MESDDSERQRKLQAGKEKVFLALARTCALRVRYSCSKSKNVYVDYSNFPVLLISYYLFLISWYSFRKKSKGKERRRRKEKVKKVAFQGQTSARAVGAKAKNPRMANILHWAKGQNWRTLCLLKTKNLKGKKKKTSVRQILIRMHLLSPQKLPRLFHLM